MKTAICFAGTGRSLEYTHLNLKKNLIDCFSECDVFILAASGAHSHKVEEFFSKHDRVKAIIIEKESEPDLSGLRFRSGWPDPTRSSRQIYMKMIAARSRMEEIISENEKSNNFKYDRVIFSRLDVSYFSPVGNIIKNLDMDYLHVPDFHNTFGGVIDGFNDRFAVGNRRDMGQYFKIPDSIALFIKAGGEIHAETLLKWHLMNNKVKVLKSPIRFTRVKPGGIEEDTRIENISEWNFGDT